jgi:hypothetical protein
MPQSTAVEVVTVLKTVDRHGYSTFAKKVEVLELGGTLIRLWTNGESSTRADPHGN